MKILLVFGVLLLLIGRFLPSLALRRRVSVVMGVLALTLIGVIGMFAMPLELMPNFAYQTVSIQVGVRGGMPPPEIERLIVAPIEATMQGIANLKYVLSRAKKDQAIVNLVFEAGSDMDVAVLAVREKFFRAKSKLPQEIEKPVIGRYEENDAPVMVVGLTSLTRTPEGMRQWVDKTLKPQIQRVDGVANVEVFGGRERKIIANLNRHQLFSHRLSLSQIAQVMENNNLTLRVGESPEALERLNSLRVLGSFRTIDEIASFALSEKPNAQPVRLNYLGTVEDSFLEHESYARLNGQSAVNVYIQKESNANTVTVVSSVEKIIDQFLEVQTSGIEMVPVSNQKNSILAAISSVRDALLLGVLLVLAVLPLFLAKTFLSRWIAAGMLAFAAVILLAENLALFSPSVFRSLVLGGVFSLLLLTFWRRDFLTALAVSISLLLSVCMALGFFYMGGLTLNAITLSGLVLGIGLLVDNAIVVVENFDRIAIEKPRISLGLCAFKAAREMVLPMMAGTLTTIVVFVPFAFLSTQTQLMFGGISYAVTASLLSSLFVSLSFLPLLLSGINVRAHYQESRGVQVFVERVQRIGSAFYMPLSVFFRSGSYLGKAAGVVVAVVLLLLISVFKLGVKESLYVCAVAGVGVFAFRGIWSFEKAFYWLLRNYKHVSAALLIFIVSALAILFFSLPKDFLSMGQNNEFTVFVEMDSGVQLEIANRISTEVEEAVKNNESTRSSIKNITSRVEGWSSKIYVSLKNSEDRELQPEEVIAALRPVVEDVMRKYEKDYKTFAFFSEPRSGKEMVVEIFGYDYNSLSQLAMELAGYMGQESIFKDTRIHYRPGQKQYSFYVEGPFSATLGLNTQTIASELHAQMRGLKAMSFYENNEEIETVVRLHPDERKTLSQVQNLFILNKFNEMVPLGLAAKTVEDLSPSEIWHKNKARMVQVSTNLGDTPLDNAAESLHALIKKINFPTEYYAAIGGQYDDMVRSAKEFKWALAAVLFLVYAVMACQFESFWLPLIIMVTVPLAIIGAVALLIIGKTSVTMGVWVGILMLAGLVVNNGIMLIEQIQRLWAIQTNGSQIQELPHGKAAAGLQNTAVNSKNIPAVQTVEEICLLSAQNRRRAIFMTTSTTVLGLLPMVFDKSDSAGLWAPLALTVLGGLSLATVLTLLGVPVLVAVCQRRLAVLG